MRSTLFGLIFIYFSSLPLSISATPIDNEPVDATKASSQSILLTIPDTTGSISPSINLEHIPASMDALPPISFAKRIPTIKAATEEESIKSESLFDNATRDTNIFNGLSSYGTLFGEPTSNKSPAAKNNNAFMESVFHPNAYQEPIDTGTDRGSLNPSEPQSSPVNLKKLLKENLGDDAALRDLANSAQEFYRSHNLGGVEYYDHNIRADAGFGQENFSAQSSVLGKSMAVTAQQPTTGTRRNWGEESFTTKAVAFLFSWKGALILVFLFMLDTFVTKLSSR
ncbi:hypothetical protein A9Q99_22685 [Gammaproteobacteria bacterium 45_16_T64]|mgnify:CR=1 FL=1|nr:hypothetical protein A9Q99_22685 [Gammaproteobacteria bacterium 45_16_T64]